MHLSYIKNWTKSIKADFNSIHFHLFYPQNSNIVLIWMIQKNCSPFSFLLRRRITSFTEMKEANNLSCSFFVSKRLKYSIILFLSNSVVLSKHFNLLQLQEGPVTWLFNFWSRKRSLFLPFTIYFFVFSVTFGLLSWSAILSIFDLNISIFSFYFNYK